MPFAISILIGYKTKFMAGIYIILGKYLQSILYFWYLIDWFATNERAPSTSYQLKTLIVSVVRTRSVQSIYRVKSKLMKKLKKHS